MKTPVLLTALVFLLLSACSKSENYSENDLVEIYARIELEPVEKSIAMIEKYELDNEKKRDAYYNALREMATHREKWENFLTRVDQFRQNQPVENP